MAKMKFKIEKYNGYLMLIIYRPILQPQYYTKILLYTKLNNILAALYSRL